MPKPIQFECPVCLERWHVAYEDRAKTLECPRCRNLVQLGNHQIFWAEAKERFRTWRETGRWLAEQQRKASEAERLRLAEEQRKAAETQRLRIAEEQQKATETQRLQLAEKQRKAAEAERLRLAQEQQKSPTTAPRYACSVCGGLFPVGRVYDDNGVITCKRCFSEQSSTARQVLDATSARSLPAAGAAGGGLIVAGYVCGGVALLFCPLGFGIAGIVIGIINLTRGAVGHGIAQIVISVGCTIVGTMLGAAAWATVH